MLLFAERRCVGRPAGPATPAHLTSENSTGLSIANARAFTPGGARLPLSKEQQLRSDVNAALHHPETVKLAKAPGLPKDAKGVDIDFGWGHATTAFRVGDGVYVRKTTQKLGPTDAPIGPAKHEWFQLGTVPASLTAALEPKASPADVLKKLHVMPRPEGGYSKQAPKKEDVLVTVDLPGRRPHSFSAHILKGHQLVIERRTTGGVAPFRPGEEVFSKPIALPKDFAPQGFDWKRLAFVLKTDM